MTQLAITPLPVTLPYGEVEEVIFCEDESFVDEAAVMALIAGRSIVRERAVSSAANLDWASPSFAAPGLVLLAR
jgi:hypothetical protein